MEKDRENLVNTSEKQDLTPIRNEKGQIVSGTANPNGRPKGSRDFYSDFKEAIVRIKDKNSGESLTEQDIIKIGLEKMLKGDARFEGLYKDLMDRVYGKPMQKTDITTNGKDIVQVSDEDRRRLDLILANDKQRSS